MIKRAVSLPLEDKHVVNEHHVIRKNHDATQKKMSSRGAFQCTMWLVWMKLAASKTLLWRWQKNLWTSRSTGKSNVTSYIHFPKFLENCILIVMGQKAKGLEIGLYIELNWKKFCQVAAAWVTIKHFCCLEMLNAVKPHYSYYFLQINFSCKVS